MASTRNKNMPNDYCLQQRSYMDARNYNQYAYSQFGRAYNNALPNMGVMPSRMPREAFSSNSVEIESALFGINSTNLVTPQKPVDPKLIKLPEIAYFDRLPMYMPENMVVQTDQRPFPIPK